MGNNTKHERNNSIQLIRVIAMFMIIMDHILGRLAFPLQPIIVQIFNSGVFIFVFISGLLFGKQKVTNWKKWIKKRLIRIGVPLWIFMIIDFIIESALWNNFNIKYVFIYAFNLQGILGVNIGGTNLWFLTLIMFCYVLTPVFQKLKQQKYSRKSVCIIGILTVFVQVALAYGTDVGMVAGHTLSWCVIAIGMYIIGYFASDKLLFDGISKRRILTLTVFTMIISCIVLICRLEFDGQIIYDRIIIYYGMVVIDIWICTVVYKLGLYIKSKMLIRVITHLDAISYEFYIVHGLIIAAVTSFIQTQFGFALYIICTVILGYLAAIVLHGLCILIKSLCVKFFYKIG